MSDNNYVEMGEDAIHPNQSEGADEDSENLGSTLTPEEYAMLDSQLDDLNSALDVLEHKNDTIQAQLLQLLNSNRAMREEMQQEKEKCSLNPSTEPEEGSSQNDKSNDPKL